MEHYPDYETYADIIENKLATLHPQQCVKFAVECVRRSILWCQQFFEGNSLVDPKFFDTTISSLAELLYSATNSEELEEQLRLARAKARQLQEFASLQYDRCEGMKDLNSASPDGVAAFRADFAVSALSHAILAALGDDIFYTSSRAAALSWAACLFDEREKKWQEQLLSSM